MPEPLSDQRREEIRSGYPFSRGLTWTADDAAREAIHG